MTIRQDVPSLEKQLYVAPGIQTINVQCEQAIMTASGVYGTPGEDPVINDFGEF